MPATQHMLRPPPAPPRSVVGDWDKESAVADHRFVYVGPKGTWCGSGGGPPGKAALRVRPGGAAPGYSSLCFHRAHAARRCTAT